MDLVGATRKKSKRHPFEKRWQQARKVKRERICSCHLQTSKGISMEIWISGIRFKCIPYCCGLQQNNTADEQEQVGKQVGNFIVQDLKIQILPLSMLYSTGNFVLLRWCQGQDVESTKVCRRWMLFLVWWFLTRMVGPTTSFLHEVGPCKASSSPGLLLFATRPLMNVAQNVAHGPLDVQGRLQLLLYNCLLHWYGVGKSHIYLPEL